MNKTDYATFKKQILVLLNYPIKNSIIVPIVTRSFQCIVN